MNMKRKIQRGRMKKKMTKKKEKKERINRQYIYK